VATLAGWQDAYYIVGTTSITENPSFSDSTCIGTYGEGAPQTFTSNHPEFSTGLAILEEDKATSFSYYIKGDTIPVERTTGVLFPDEPLEASLDNLSAFLPLLTLLQTPESGFVNETTKTFVPYTSNSINWYTSLLRTTEDGYSYKIIGAIAHTVTIKGVEGEEITISTDWAGANISTASTSSVASWSTSACRNPLLFQDLTFAYESTAQTVDLSEFEIVITNNAKHPTYNSSSVVRHLLEDLEITGTFKVPWESVYGGQNEFITRLLSGDSFMVYLWWGNYSPSQEGDFSIAINIEADTVSLSGQEEDEDTNEVTFTGVFDGTNDAIKIISYFGEIYPTYTSQATTFHVLDASASEHECSTLILGSSYYYVPRAVLDDDGNSFTCV
jgi:hypothetical protein